MKACNAGGFSSQFCSFCEFIFLYIAVAICDQVHDVKTTITINYY